MTNSEFNPTEADLLYHYKDYMQHIQWVMEGMGYVINKLLLRMLTHDRTKIEEPELSAYAEIVPGFKGLEYGTPEHEAHGGKLGPAWEHHTRHNKHHPEYFPAGHEDMTLVDLLEMVCDWRAASMRSGGIFDYEKSLAVFEERYAADRQVILILRNTCKMINMCGEFPSKQNGI